MTLGKLKKKFLEISVLRESGKVEESIEEYRILMGIAEKYYFSQVPQMIGVAYRMLDKNSEGVPFAKTSVQWAIKAKDKDQEANCRRDLGGLYSSLESFDKAEKEYEKSLKIIWQENEGRVNGIAGTISAMGRLAGKRKDYVRAHRLTKTAIAMTYPSLIEHPNDQDTGQHYLFILHEAEIYRDENDNKKAVELAKIARDAFKKLGQTVRQERAEKLIKEISKPNKNF